MLALREADDSVILNAIVEEAQQIAQEWRKDLATRIGNELGEHLRRTFG